MSTERVLLSVFKIVPAPTADLTTTTPVPALPATRSATGETYMMVVVMVPPAVSRVSWTVLAVVESRNRGSSGFAVEPKPIV